MRFYAFLKSKLAWHRLFPVRHRYFVTRSRLPRMRYVAGCVAALCVGVFSLLAAPGPLSAVNIAGGFDVAALAPAAGVEGGVVSSESQIEQVLKAGVSSGIRKASFAFKKAEPPRYKQLQIRSGDTVAGVLQNAGLSGSEAYRAVKALQEYYDVRKVRSGQKINVYFEPGAEEQPVFSHLEMKLSPVKVLNVKRGDEEGGAFAASVDEKELFPKVYAGKAKIETSLYGSAARANIPSAVIAEMIRVYSWNIDFQRDIRQGDEIEVLYEAFETEDGEFAKYGDVLYASLSVGGRSYPVYRFEMDDGRIDYFEPDGMSVRKTLMKTPVDGARLSSGFGMRKHPVLGYNKMHKGVDFAAPTGTPIYAAGDGVVERAGRNGGYGNYVRIRHNSKLKTAYAHLHKIKSGVSQGARVKQGEVIGYVGTTGRSTGPHLHYEVLVNNAQVNPRSVKLPTGEQLSGDQLKRFKNKIGGVRQQYVSLSEGLKFAQFGGSSKSNIH